MLSPRIRRRGFTLIELLVVMAIIGILSSLIVPAVRRGQTEAQKLQCANNLKGIYTFAMLYAGQKERRAYPIGSGKTPEAHLSIQTLVDTFPLDFEPELFVCPEGEATKAGTDPDGRFVLDADTSSYSWVGSRMKTTTRRKSLTSDKYIQDFEDDDGTHSGHEGGMNVATTDGAVDFWALERLDETSGLPRGLVR